MRSSTVCICAAVTPISVSTRSRISETKSAAPRWRRTDVGEYLHIMARCSLHLIADGHGELEYAPLPVVVREVHLRAEQRVLLRDRRSGSRAGGACGQERDLDAHDLPEVRDLVGSDVL